MNSTLRWYFIALLFTCWSQLAAAQDAQVAVPINAVDGILTAFKTHSIVALDEGNHGNEQGAAFRLSLIRDPRFPLVVNDIVVEFGNSLYQGVIDRFVDGQAVPEKELQQVWQNTTQRQEWDKPIYEQFFRAVRDLNLRLPKTHRLRVILGDPPIDWGRIKSETDLRKIDRPDSFPVGVIQREVLDKGRKALVIYGGLHYLRKNLYWQHPDRQRAERDFNAPVDSIVTLLEGNHPGSIFSIYTNTNADLTKVGANAASWQAPQLVILRGTEFGAASFTMFYTAFATKFNPDGSTEQFGLDPVRSPKMQDEYDALLYLGPPSSITYSKISPKLCSDPEYLKMRQQRFAFLGAQAERFGAALRASCAEVSAK